MKNTNWSSPKTNFLAGMLDLRKALAAGQKARLVRARNEDCEYPIKTKVNDVDFRNYEFRVGYPTNRRDIMNDTSMSDFEKYLSLNYKTHYGTEEAMNRYYETGKLSADNFKGMGRSHLVKVEDMVKWLLATGEKKNRAETLKQQYLTLETAYHNHFYDFYRYKHSSEYIAKKFKRKLWVVELLKADQTVKVPFLIKILNVLLYPVKFIPRRSVLRMPEYENVTFRIGSVVNGIAVEFQIPKKFSFK